MAATHTSFKKGSRIRIILHGGTQVVTKFVQKVSDKKIKTEAGVFNIPDIRSANYYKPLPWER